MVRMLLHIEGAVVMFVCAYLIFFHLGHSWWLLPVFVLGPDVSMVGYFANPRVGAILYNIAHTYAVAVPIALVGLITSAPVLLLCGLILTGHIGMDRMFGYGLKYATAFKDTHFQRLARP